MHLNAHVKQTTKDSQHLWAQPSYRQLNNNLPFPWHGSRDPSEPFLKEPFDESNRAN
jgi:hypothetical protein